MTKVNLAVLTAAYLFSTCFLSADAERYAPYVHVRVSSCSQTASGSNTKWTCTGIAGGFAVSDDYKTTGTTADMCNYYCPQDFTTLWTTTLPSSSSAPTVMLGGSPATIPSSCIKTRVAFKCYSKISETAPMNVLSIMLYGTPDAANYYFSTDPDATCTPSVQCSAYRLLKKTLYGMQQPALDDVNTIRGTPYSCILTYIGASSIGSAQVCFEQLGPMCFRPANLTEMCITGDTPPYGITNSGSTSVGAMTICTFDNEAKKRASSYKIDATFVPYGFSTCGSIIVNPESAITVTPTVDFTYDNEMVKSLKRYSGIILNVPTTCTIIESSTYRSQLISLLRTMMVIYNANGVVLDMSEVTTGCFTVTNLQTLVTDLKVKLAEVQVYNILIKMPIKRAPAYAIRYAVMPVTAFIIPGDKLYYEQLSKAAPSAITSLVCQTPWDYDSTYESLLDYMLYLKMPSDKTIMSLGFNGYVAKGTSWYKLGGSLTSGKLLLADAVVQNLQCGSGQIGSTCCTGVNRVPEGTTTTSINSAYVKVEDLIAITSMTNNYFGINQFVMTNVDSDYMTGRESLPSLQKILANTKNMISFRVTYPSSRMGNLRSLLLGEGTAGSNGTFPFASDESDVVHGTSRSASVRAEGGTSSGDDSNIITPKYRVGTGPLLVCPGMIATVGSVYITNIPYVEFSASNLFETVYAADISKTFSCTPGTPSTRLPITDKVPQFGVDVNTLVSSVRSNAYIIGVSLTGVLVEYVPPVQAVCQDVNEVPLDRLSYVVVDDELIFKEPTVSTEKNIIVAPMGIYNIMSDFTYGVDYINFKSVCIDYDIDAMPSCAITVCGGDLSCINTYGSVCSSASTILTDARRSGQLMRNAFDELAIEEKKAMIYADLADTGTSRSGTDTSLAEEKGRKSPRIIGTILLGVGVIGSLIMGGEALRIAKETAKRVDVLEKQLDLTKNQIVELGNQMVTITNKLNQNIEMTNQRIDDLQDQMNQQFKVVNNNFQQLSADLKALQSEVNTRFKVMFGYQTWYAQMVSITTQLTQAAIQMNHKTVNVKSCLLNLEDGIMGVCPSGLEAFVEYPGLANVHTVQALLYMDRKLIIVNRYPRKIVSKYFHKAIGLPTMNGDVPCWPDYDVALVDGKYYHAAECETRFCNELNPYPEFDACLEDPGKCNVVCSKCYKNICWENGKYVWESGTINASIPATAPPTFIRPEFNYSSNLFPDLNVNLSDPELLEQLNTSIVLNDIRGDLQGVLDSLAKYEAEYDALSALRTKSTTNDILFIVSIVWLAILTIVLLYLSCKGKLCCKPKQQDAAAGGGAAPVQITNNPPAPSLGDNLGALAFAPGPIPPQARIAAGIGSLLLNKNKGGKGGYMPLVNLE